MARKWIPTLVAVFAILISPAGWGFLPGKTMASNVTFVDRPSPSTTQSPLSVSVDGLGAGPALTASPAMSMTMPAGKIIHVELYITDGYINSTSGAWPPVKDASLVPGWDKPVYIWGFSDLDPNIAANRMKVPEGAGASKGGLVGNAKFPSPFIDVRQGDQVYFTAHNRGFFQENQAVQDQHTVHFHGIHAQTPYDGFPESAGSYEENLRYFWQEPWYLALGDDTRTRDGKWNAMSAEDQKKLLAANPPLIKKNALSPAGGIRSQFDRAPWPEGVFGLPASTTVEDVSQFTFYFEATHPGTYMYHCHVSAPEHVHMGMYGALIVRPADYSPTNLTVYGAGTNSEYDIEYTILLSEIDPAWHKSVETAAMEGFDPANFKPRLWMMNGRTFPQTLLPFAWNLPDGGSEVDPRYNTSIKVKANQRFLVRWISVGFEDHSIHQHGWHLRIVGSDGRPWKEQIEKFTLTIGSGETYDTITLANPVYGVTEPAGSPLSDHRPWRQIYPIHDHNDYEVTTNSIYPGGLATLIEAVGVPGVPPNTPTWLNPYLPEPGEEEVPAPPEPASPETEE